MKLPRGWLVLLLACLSTASAQDVRPIDTGKSTLTVRVYKSGLFSAFAHDHEIHAPIESGTFSEASPAVELSVDARKLRVIDPGVSDKDRAEIQETMLSPKVLDSQQFKEIRFRSTRIEPQGPGKWMVGGDLTLHGQTRPVKVQVEGGGGRYRGAATLLQKDFGMEPIRIAGGTVRVKNEVRVEFEILGK